MIGSKVFYKALYGDVYGVVVDILFPAMLLSL